MGRKSVIISILLNFEVVRLITYFFALNMCYLVNESSLSVLVRYLLSIMIRRDKHFSQSYDVMYICPAKIVSCPSKTRFDRAPADESFQALIIMAKHVIKETQSKIILNYPTYS